MNWTGLATTDVHGRGPRPNGRHRKGQDTIPGRISELMEAR